MSTSRELDAAAAEALLEDSWGQVTTILDRICRRNGLEGDDADSFRSYAHERLVEHDYRMLRAFSGRSSLKTFLTASLVNAFP